MDLLTQGLLGAVTARAAARPDEALRAASIGFAAGLLPDADVLIRSSEDALLVLDYHRHFSHALIFIPVGGLLATLALRPFVRGLSLSRLYLFAVLGYALAGLLDACTSYGTHLLWPLDRPVAWSVVSIVDPVVTLLLAGGLFAAMRSRRRAAATVALAGVAIYLGLGALQHARAEAEALAEAQRRGHAPRQMLVKPSFGNIILWRAIYLDGDTVHALGLRLPPFGAPRVYGGEAAPRLSDAALDRIAEPGSRARSDLARFGAFSRGFLIRHPARPDMIGDARYSLLPTELRPLWGVTLDPAGADHAVHYVTERKMTPEVRSRFLAMLFGEPEA